MDDGGASACSMILFLVMLFIEAVLVGFNKAVSLMNEKEIERRAEEDKDKSRCCYAGSSSALQCTSIPFR